MAAATATKQVGPVTIEPLVSNQVVVEIRGTSGYIPGKWSEKAKMMMPGHPSKPVTKPGSKAARPVKVPHEEAEARVYRLPDGRPGIPATAIKAAMTGACRFYSGLKMVETKVALYIHADGLDADGTPLIAIEYEGDPQLREDMARNATGVADLRYRYQFNNWRAKVTVEYIEQVMTRETVAALIDAGGRLGVGDWRPSSPHSHTGTFGCWRAASL